MKYPSIINLTEQIEITFYNLDLNLKILARFQNFANWRYCIILINEKLP